MLVEEKMVQERSLCCSQRRQAHGHRQFPHSPREGCLSLQRRPIVTNVRSSDFASVEIGSDAEETELLAAARVGHPSAFTAIVERYATRLCHMAFRITRNREDAEDAVQECFKNAFAHLESFRGQSRFSTWLTSIARNCALMRIRSRRSELISPISSLDSLLPAEHRHGARPTLSPEERYLRKELEHLLTAEIARLSPTLQAPMILCHMEGLLGRHAAKLLGISNSALKARLHRGRLALRSRLEDLGIKRKASAKRRRVGSGFSSRRGGSPGLIAPTAQRSAFGD